jgi:hypothetical protein
MPHANPLGVEAFSKNSANEFESAGNPGFLPGSLRGVPSIESFEGGTGGKKRLARTMLVPERWATRQCP